MKKTKQNNKSTDLEKEYNKIFEYRKYSKVPVSRSLKQPSPFKKVQTYVTYGACEDPI